MSVRPTAGGGDANFTCNNCETEYQLKQLNQSETSDKLSYNCPECGNEVYSTPLKQ